MPGYNRTGGLPDDGEPLVLYQGGRAWPHSAQLADLLPAAVRLLPWAPRVEHVLLDQTRLAPESVSGRERGRLAQLLLMAWARGGEDRLAQAPVEGPVGEPERTVTHEPAD